MQNVVTLPYLSAFSAFVMLNCVCPLCDVVQDEPSQEQQTQEYAVDQWIIDFANLFREHTGD